VKEIDGKTICQKIGRALGVSVLLMLALTMSGCLRDNDNLELYIARVKTSPGGEIEEIPTIKPYSQHEYSSVEMKNPFHRYSTGPIAIDQPKNPVVDLSLCPDPDRRRQLLEEFTLDSLRMVGTLNQDEEIFVLIRSPDNIVHRVTHGDYLGTNYGRIRRIEPTLIEIVEIISSSRGCEERNASLKLEGTQ
jgi:type IV pilus assembly protein PilP